MVKDLEQEIRNLQKGLAGIQKDQASLRLQPCHGDSEILSKDAKIEELDRRAAILGGAIRDLTRKYQLIISAAPTKGGCGLSKSANSAFPPTGS